MIATKNDLEQPLVEVLEEKKTRFLGLDLMRGFIMVVMAWDHVKDVIFEDSRINGSEVWSGEFVDFNNSVTLMLSRIVSDICAPGFFFTMGMGMTFLYESRKNKGWSDSKITWFLVKRGLFMILLERFSTVFFSFSQLVAILEGYEDSKGTTLTQFFKSSLFIMTVLGILGTSMIFCAILILRPLANWGSTARNKFLICFLIFSVSYTLSNIVVVHYQGEDLQNATDVFPGILAKPKTVWEVLVRLLFLPGPGFASSYDVYPLFPWIGLAALGIGAGFVAKEQRQRFYFNLRYWGLLGLVLFLLVRSVGGKFGNLRGWPRGDGKNEHIDFIIEFFSTLKYPPSLAYTLWTMGVNCLVLSWLSTESLPKLMEVETFHTLSTIEKAKLGFIKLLKSFGMSPLFFYVSHLLVINLIGIICGWIFGVTEEGRFRVNTLLPLVPIWVMILAIFYPLCNKYSEFKGKTAIDSVWRYM